MLFTLNSPLFTLLHTKRPETLVSGSFILLQLKRSGIELIILAVFRNQLLMIAALDDMAELQHHNNICVLNRGQTVRDNEHRTSVHEAVHAGLHDGLRAGINRAGRLIKNHNRRIGNSRTRDGKQLALTLRQTAAVAVDDSIIAVRQSADEVVRVGQLRRCLDLLVGRIQAAVADIIANGAGKQVGILQNDTERAAKIGFFDLIDIDAVVADLAVCEVVETVDQVGDGVLPAPVAPTNATF